MCATSSWLVCTLHTQQTEDNDCYQSLPVIANELQLFAYIQDLWLRFMPLYCKKRLLSLQDVCQVK